jgi:uncharacterized NAD(P)/FAD-binding protein YdhS
MVGWRSRGGDTEATVVKRIINCIGPMTDPTRSTDPLTRSLLNEGLARLGALGLGLDTSADGAIVTASGAVSGRLFGIGPVCRAALWEIIALQDIRVQAESLAHRITRQLTLDVVVSRPGERQATPHLRPAKA